MRLEVIQDYYKIIIFVDFRHRRHSSGHAESGEGQQHQNEASGGAEQWTQPFHPQADKSAADRWRFGEK